MFFAKFDEKNKVWSNDDVPCILNPKISIAHALLRSLQLNGSKIAQVNSIELIQKFGQFCIWKTLNFFMNNFRQISDDSGEEFTFDEIHVQTIRIAQNLQKRGYTTPKQVFGIVANNVPHLAAVVFASFCLGCPVNATHAATEKANMLYTFQITQPSVLFCEVGVYDLVKECVDEIGLNMKIFTFNGVKGDSEPVENLLQTTQDEDDFL